MVSKVLRLFGDEGAGKNTILGSLIYKCGLDLPQLELLQRSGVQEYAKIGSFFKEKGLAQAFYTPSAHFVVEENASPDVLLWVVDTTASDSGIASSDKLVALLSSGEVRPKEKVLVLANKMDLVDWSESAFAGVVRAFTKVNLGFQNVSIIPISALRDVNLLESAKEPPWVKEISADRFEESKLASEKPLIQLLG